MWTNEGIWSALIVVQWVISNYSHILRVLCDLCRWMNEVVWNALRYVWCVILYGKLYTKVALRFV